MTRPSKVRLVQPANIAQFHAARYLPDDNYNMYAIEWLANNFGWRISPLVPSRGFYIYGRNGKKYTVLNGDWVIALGTNGSIRVCSDKQYRQDYREVSE